LPACTTAIRTWRSCSFNRRPARSLKCMAQPIARMIWPYQNIALYAHRGHPVSSLSRARSTRSPKGGVRPERWNQMTNAMTLLRRQFLHLAAGAIALPAVSRVTWAETYPSQPVRVIVGFAAGGPNDILARLIGQWLAKRLGQPFVIENRLGTGSNI